MADSAEPVFDPRQILLTLAEHDVEFVVVGGVAVQAHGHGRSTRDLDVIPRPDLLNLSRLGEALAALSAELIRADRPIDVTDPQLLKRAPLIPLVTSHGRLDLLDIETTAGAPRSYRELSERAIVAELDGRAIRLAGVDDLLRMKRAAGRPTDLDDIGALTRSDDQLQDEAGQST